MLPMQYTWWRLTLSVLIFLKVCEEIKVKFILVQNIFTHIHLPPYIFFTNVLKRQRKVQVLGPQQLEEASGSWLWIHSTLAVMAI